MSNYSIILLKMNTCLSTVLTYFENVIHPAAGKTPLEKKHKRPAVQPASPRATPDSLNIRDGVKRQESFRRNPVP